MCEHKPKVNETKSRSAVKSFTAYVGEVAVDVVVISIFPFIGIPALVTALTIEGICLANHFIWERIWNKVQWGRKVEQ